MALESVRLPATILQNGGRLGPYEITSQIGAGGPPSFATVLCANYGEVSP